MVKHCIVTILTVLLLTVPVSAVDSGTADLPKLSQQEIIALLKNTTTEAPQDIYLEAPQLSSPYSPGSVQETYLNQAQARLSALRRLAGLLPVQRDATYDVSAQYGALLLSASNFDHQPVQPYDMDDATYYYGLEATMQGNLFAHTDFVGYMGSANVFLSQLDSLMGDSDIYNLDHLGHRRWFLNPALKYVGFGYTRTSASQYAVTRIFDQSGYVGDYEFIGWPASGNFPSDLFPSNTAWSVSLNPSKYQVPRANEIHVVITGNGQRWELGGNRLYTVSGQGPYFTIENSEYGIPNCIIFRPDSVTNYVGDYTVTIYGVKDSDGNPVDFSYTTTFFNSGTTPDVREVNFKRYLRTGAVNILTLAGSFAAIQLIRRRRYLR